MTYATNIGPMSPQAWGQGHPSFGVKVAQASSHGHANTSATPASKLVSKNCWTNVSPNLRSSFLTVVLYALCYIGPCYNDTRLH